MTTTIQTPDAEKIQRGHSDLLEQAKEVTITDAMSHGLAQTLFKDLTRAERVVGEELDPIISNAHKAHRGLTSLKSKLILPITEAKVQVSGLMMDYEDEEKKKAKREAELLAIEEKKREEEEVIDHAANLEEAGDTEGAEEVMSAPIPKPLVTVDAAVAKVKGVHGRRSWKAEVVSMIALVKHVAANPGDINLLKPNDSALNKLAQAKDGKTGIPGVREYEKKSHSARLG